MDANQRQARGLREEEVGVRFEAERLILSDAGPCFKRVAVG